MGDGSVGSDISYSPHPAWDLLREGHTPSVMQGERTAQTRAPPLCVAAPPLCVAVVQAAPVPIGHSSSRGKLRRVRDEEGFSVEGALSVPPSPSRCNRDSSWNPLRLCAEPDAELSAAKRSEFVVELNKLLQRRNWDQLAHAIDLTRTAKWRGGDGRFFPGCSAVFPGRAREMLQEKLASIELIHRHVSESILTPMLGLGSGTQAHTSSAHGPGRPRLQL